MTYNGWSNYETWAVSLWYSNDEYNYTRVQEAVEDARAEFDDAYPDYIPGTKSSDEDLESLKNEVTVTLRDKLEEMVQIDFEEASIDGLFSDLVSSALSETDWYEWAENLLEF